MLNHSDKPNLATFVVGQGFNDSCLACLVGVNYLTFSDINSGVVEVGTSLIREHNDVADFRNGDSTTYMSLLVSRVWQF